MSGDGADISLVATWGLSRLAKHTTYREPGPQTLLVCLGLCYPALPLLLSHSPRARAEGDD